MYGYGNPGRQDDGVGNALVEKLEPWIKEKQLKDVEIDSNYQLNIEDAAEIAHRGIVIFVDATIEEHVNDFIITKVQPSDKVNYTMHAVSPGFVLDLCKKMYDEVPDVFLVHIKGYQWDMKEELTKQAEENMNKALDFIMKTLLYPDLMKIKEIFNKTAN